MNKPLLFDQFPQVLDLIPEDGAFAEGNLETVHGRWIMASRYHDPAFYIEGKEGIVEEGSRDES